MNLDFQTFLRIAKPILDAKLPLLLRGRHGIGKSQVVYQIAAERNLPVVERRASQMSEGDLVGLPVISGDTTSWNPPDWFKKALP
jgi:MoxR-like ATPase